MQQNDWTVEYYIDDGGGVPVREFLGALDQKTYGRFQWSLQQLSVRNTSARPPLVKHIEGTIWELREESSTNIYRLLYVFFSGRRIVLLHAFAKKTQKLPRRELEIAQARLARFEERERR